MGAGQRRDANAGPGDDDHGHRGGRGRPGAVEDSTPRPGLPAGPGRAEHPVRDLFDGDRARRLGREPVQRLGQPLFLVSHDATPPLRSSARPGECLSRASAFAEWDFTVPTEQPMAAAVWASVWSAK